MNFPHEKFGLPIIANYSYELDLALLRSKMASSWVRQRRTYTHAASLFNVTFRVTTAYAQELVQWLQDNNDWMFMTLLNGNDAGSFETLHDVEVRRTTDITSTRVSRLDQFEVSFQVETRSLSWADEYLATAMGAPSVDYPAALPAPIMDGFSATHSTRNVTTYSMSYRMKTETLKKWQEFAAFMGTGWFRSRMVSPNVPCGYEWMRYTTNPTVSLERPNVFIVTVQAETMPASYSIEGIAPPTGGGGTVDPPLPPPGSSCTYDDINILYDEDEHPYVCSGAYVPPVLPSGVFVGTLGSKLASAAEYWYREARATIRVYGPNHPTYPKQIHWYTETLADVVTFESLAWATAAVPAGTLTVNLKTLVLGALQGTSAVLSDTGFVEFYCAAKGTSDTLGALSEATATFEVLWNGLVGATFSATFSASSSGTDIITPPTNYFVAPGSNVLVQGYATGVSPLTVSATIRLHSDGAVSTPDSFTPSWPRWWSVTPDPAYPITLALGGAAEYSYDGVTWLPVAGANIDLMLAAYVSIRSSTILTDDATVNTAPVTMTFTRAGVPVGTATLSQRMIGDVTDTPPPPSEFVSNFGVISSSSYVPYDSEATAAVTVYGPTAAATPGMVAGVRWDQDVFEEIVSYAPWVAPGQTAPAGVYTVEVTNSNGEVSPSNGTYALPSAGSVLFTLTAQGTSPTRGSTKSGSATLSIKKDGVTVSTGTATFSARSAGVIN